MTAAGPSMPPDLDRLLAGATVPDMSAGLIDRIVAEAARPDRPALPVAPPRRSRGRQWTRRGVWTGVVAVNLMLATAVAAAFGGGALTFARIATVARHVAENIARPFHYAAPRVAPAPPAVVHRLAVPAAAIATTPRIALPMTAPREVIGPPAIVRPRFQPALPMRSPAHPLRPIGIDRGHPQMRAGPHVVRHVSQRPRLQETPRAIEHHTAGHRGEGFRPHTLRTARAEPPAPLQSPIAPRADPLPRVEGGVGREAPNRERGLQGEGGTRFDGARWQAANAAAPEGRPGDRAGMPGQDQDRSPGWRRRMQGGNPGAQPPGWRRRAGANGPGLGRPGGRMKPPRPGGGGRHPRRF